MKISLASDHAAYELKREIKKYLKSRGHEVKDFGVDSGDSVDYPDYAYPAAVEVAEGKADFGIVICGSGIGMSMVCNKVKGIRSANCVTTEMAQLARQHNNANILNMGARLIDTATALQITETFLSIEFEGGRHNNRVEKVHSLTGR